LSSASSAVRALDWDDDATTVDDETRIDAVPNCDNEEPERPVWCRKQVAAFFSELLRGVRGSRAPSLG
jgi:hypothetical protein